MKKIFSIVLTMVLTLVLVSCGTEKPTGPVADVSNLQYAVDGRQVTLTWDLPAAEKVLALQVVYEKDKTFTETDGPTTSYVIERAPVGQDVTYTIRVITENGISKGAQITFFIQPEKQPMPAMLLLAEDPETLPDDDEIAMAEWFKANYVDKNQGVFIKVEELKTLSPDDYSVVIIFIDRVGIGKGWRNLPLEVVLEENRKGMLKYLAEGGNFFFAKMATQLVDGIGRIDEKYAPGLYGDGEGGVGARRQRFPDR